MRNLKFEKASVNVTIVSVLAVALSWGGVAAAVFVTNGNVSDMRVENAVFRSEVRADNAAFRDEVRADNAAFRDEVRADNAKTLEAVERLSEKIDALDARLSEIEREQARQQGALTS